MSRVVLIGAGPVLEHQARVLLGDEVVVLEPASSDVLVTRMIWLDRRPELLVVGTAIPAVLALWIARSVRDLVDVMALQSDDDTIREQAKSCGISEFLAEDAELETVDALFDTARERVIKAAGIGVPRRAGASAQPGAIVVVTSPKGGVGKTTVAANVAVGLAVRHKTVLVDLDAQFGDVATALGLEHRFSVVDATSKAAARDAFVLASFLVQHEGGLSVLAAPANPASADDLEPARIGHMLRQLAAEFDVVVVDTAPGLGEANIAAIEQATSLVAVAALDVPSTRGLRTEIETLRELELFPVRRHIVVNQIGPAAGLTLADVEHVIGMPADVVIPSRKAVARATNFGVPVLQAAPRDPATRALQRLVQRLEGEVVIRGPREVEHKELVS